MHLIGACKNILVMQPNIPLTASQGGKVCFNMYNVTPKAAPSLKYSWNVNFTISHLQAQTDNLKAAIIEVTCETTFT